MEEIKIGSHVRMAGKEMFLASVKEAESYGANVLMLYTGAPQNTRRKEIKDLNIEAGWAYAKQAGIREIVVHAPYIINLANTVKPETFELAVQFLEKEIRRTAAMRSHILVLHPGSALDAGAEAGIAQTVRGLNMVLDARLRKQLREAGVSYKVYKNTLIKRAAEGTEFAALDPHLEGPTALAVSKDDATAPARILAEFAKTAPNLELKGSVVEGTYYDQAGTQVIATIPSREVLLGKLLGSIQSPITNLARVLNQIAEKNGGAAEA